MSIGLGERSGACEELCEDGGGKLKEVGPGVRGEPGVDERELKMMGEGEGE